MEKPILLVDFGRLMDDQLRNGLNINKKTFILDDYVVEAIPIEWLYQKRTLYLENECYMSLMVINEILNWWEKENADL